MHDSRVEDLLRHTLRVEAESMTFGISTAVLERRLKERRAQANAKRRWLVAAAVGAVAVSASLLAVTQFRGNTTPITGASPRPSASPSPLPDASSLLAGHPDATLRLEHSVGPAAGPSAASSAPGPSPTPIEVGRVKFAGPFVIAVACIGEGQILVEVTTPSFDVPYTQAVAPCDGKPVFSEYLAAPIDPGSEGDLVRVSVSVGASWRLAVGEYPASLITPPAFAAVQLTDGWNLISNVRPTLVTTKTGAAVTMPEGASRVGVFVQCQGAVSLDVSVTGSPPARVACEAGGVTQRVEFPAVGGQQLTLEATVDGERVWVGMVMETNAEIASTYPSAPPLPAAVASAPYTAPDPNVVGFGTIGSSHQAILPISGAGPGAPSGDLLPVAVFDEATGGRLDLVSVSRSEVLRTLATTTAPAVIFDSWADATHDQVFYSAAVESGFEFHRVGVDGSGDKVLATVRRNGQIGFTAEMSADEAAFVVDACYTGPVCTLTIVDAATGAARSKDRQSDPICRILGIVGGLIVGTSRPDCQTESTTALVAVPIAGGAARVVSGDVPTPEIGSAIVVPTPDGPKVVFTDSVDSDGVPSITILDVTTGKSTDLPRGDVGDPRLMPYPVRLPEGWLLLAAGVMGDFPWQRAIDRPAPVLVNLVTGERIELVNLPHWVSNYPN